MFSLILIGVCRFLHISIHHSLQHALRICQCFLVMTSTMIISSPTENIVFPSFHLHYGCQYVSRKAFKQQSLWRRANQIQVHRTMMLLFRTECAHVLISRQSSALGGLPSQFNVFIPANAGSAKVPVLYFLAGLTCTEDNGYLCLKVLLDRQH